MCVMGWCIEGFLCMIVECHARRHARMLGVRCIRGVYVLARVKVGVGVWVHDCMGVWMHGCMGVWVYGCMGVWVYGCMGVWVFGAWVYDCMGVPWAGEWFRHFPHLH